MSFTLTESNIYVKTLYLLSLEHMPHSIRLNNCVTHHSIFTILCRALFNAGVGIYHIGVILLVQAKCVRPAEQLS